MFLKRLLLHHAIQNNSPLLIKRHSITYLYDILLSPQFGGTSGI